ncbi:6573_t:CDS:1, partial [Scutellospora calospora]
GCEGVVLLYLISSRPTFERVYRFYDQVLRVHDTEDVPIILVGNKSDKTREREISKEDMNMARRLKCEFIETSARTGINVDRVFYNVTRIIMQSKESEMDTQEWETTKTKKVQNCLIT